MPQRKRAASAADQANDPSATIAESDGRTSSSSRSNQYAQVSRSAGVGRFAGGAQRTGATTRAPVSRSPSAASVALN